jgi:choline transport protein
MLRTSWSALAGVLIVGIGAGGPPVMIYSWIGVCIVTLAVAYSMAEMCSAYPVSGGQYSWVALLAPPKVARGLSWVTGWFMITGVVAMGSTNNFIGANFILGIANLSNPDYVIERWHTVLVTFFIAVLAASVNIFTPRLLNKISTAALCWNILSFLVIVITILSTNKQPPLMSMRLETSPANHSSTGFSEFYRIWPFHGCHHWALAVLFRHVLLRCTISHDGGDEKCL